MPDFVNPQLVQSDMVLNVGSPAGVISQLPIPFAATIYTWFDLTSGADTFDHEGEKLFAMLAYVHEIWQRTAAKNEANHFDTGSISGKGSFPITFGREVVNVQWDSTALATGKGRIDGDPQIIDSGYIAFQYYGYQGQLQPIRYERQIFFPENTNADGVLYYLFPGAEGTLFVNEKDYNQVPITEAGNQPVNAGTNTFNGLWSPGGTSGITPLGTTESITLPAQDNDLFMTSKVYGLWYHFADVLTQFTDFPVWMAVMAYLTEAWQAVNCRLSGAATSTAHLVSGARNNFNSDYPISVSAQWDAVSTSGGADEVFGLSGAKMLGYYSSIHGGYMGQVQYINSEHQIMFPSGPDCTGWSVVLKPGVSGNFQVWGNPRRCQGIQTPFGDISLADGVYTGLG